MKYKCGVYKITCLENNMFYIGSSKHIEKRWKEHKKDLNLNHHANMFLQEDWNKYGEISFKFEILEETSEEERYNVEQKYLDELKPFYRIGNGYNICEKSTDRNPITLRIFQPRKIESQGLCMIAKAKGCRPCKISMDYYENSTREEIEEYCHNIQTYRDIREYAICAGDYDDWEWD